MAGGQLLAQRHRAHVSRHQQQPQLLQHLQRVARRRRWVGRPADGRAGRQLPQRGIEQGAPDEAAAIGIVLVVLVLVIAYLQNRFAGGNEA